MKPRITKNQNYDENGMYIVKLSPQQMKELLVHLNQRLADFSGKGSLPYAPVLGDKSLLKDYLIPPVKGDCR